MDIIKNFYVFDGMDGAGKDTLLFGLKDYLKSQGKDVEAIRDPGGTELGEKIRKILLKKSTVDMCSESELLLYVASRAQLVQEKILPAVNTGKIVLCSRFFDSTMVYQGYIRGFSIAQLNWLHGLCKSIVPEWTILCLVDPKEGLRRSNKRLKGGNIDEGRWEAAGLKIHEKIREGFEKHVKHIQMEQERSFSVLYTTNLTPDEAERRMIKLFKERGKP